LDFGTCILSRKHVKDFTVWNRSEIPLLFNLDVESSNVEFTDYESGKTIGSRILVKGFSQIRVSVTFTPVVIGDMHSTIYLENVNNDNNFSSIHLRSVNVLNELDKDSGLIVSDARGLYALNSLDFGDMYTGSVRTRTLTLKNTSNDTLDVYFSCEASEGTVYFSIKSGDGKTPPEREQEPKDDQNTEEEDCQRVEEIVIPPHSQQVIDVLYKSIAPKALSKVGITSPSTPCDKDSPGFTYDGLEDETSLSPRKFKLLFKCKTDRNAKSSTSLPCQAHVCTSKITTVQKHVNLGDATIGTFKYATVQVVNHSELPANISVRFVSKVITCDTKEAIIPSRQKIDLVFRLSPRKVNPKYLRQITILNKNNASNENMIEIQSNNIDKNMLTFHALFYDVHTTTSHNFVKSIQYQNPLVLNSFDIRKFNLSNIWKQQRNIRLSITSSSTDEISIYTANRNMKVTNHRSFEKNVQRLSTQPTAITTSQVSELTNTLQQNNTLHSKVMSMTILDHANGSLSPVSISSPTLDKSYQIVDCKEEMDHLVQEYEKLNFTLEQTDHNNDDQIVKRYLGLQQRLQNAIKTNKLIPCREIELKHSEQITAYAVFEPKSNLRQSHSGANLKKIEERLYIRLLDVHNDLFDTTTTPSTPYHHNLSISPNSMNSFLMDHHHQSDRPIEIPPRELIIQARICRSIMNLTQKHIHFGSVLDTEDRKKTISITNMSEVPLLYHIQKTGSINSTHLTIDDSDAEENFGIVTSYGSRELQLYFKPGLAGKFQETIAFINVQDHADTQMVTIKADIEKHERFTIQNDDLDFGIINNNEQQSEWKRIIVTNGSKRIRQFELLMDQAPWNEWLRFNYELEQVKSSGELDKLEQEKEHVEHKLRIAIRKEKKSKIPILQTRLEEIQKTLAFEKNDGDGSVANQKYKRTEQGISFSVPSGGVQVINIQCKASSDQLSNGGGESDVCGKMIVLESKDFDSKKTITFRCKINLHKSIIKSPVAHHHNQSLFIDTNVAHHDLISEIRFEPNRMDLGYISVGRKTTCKAFVRNNSTNHVDFLIIDPNANSSQQFQRAKITTSITNGTVPPDSKIPFEISIESKLVGHFQFVIKMKNRTNDKQDELYVSCESQRPNPVTFPDVKKQLEQLHGHQTISLSKYVFDMGNIYLTQSKKPHVIPFTIQNKKSTPFVIKCGTNTRQVAIYVDESMEHLADSLQLPPFGVETVHVAFDAYMSQRDYQKGTCRVLTGGMKFSIYQDDHVLHDEQVVRFKATIGHVDLQISTKKIDFGWTNNLKREYESEFVIRNESSHLPLEYVIEPSDMVIGNHGGVLHAVRSCHGSNQETIRFRFKVSEYGLNSTKFKIINVNSGQVSFVNVSAFVENAQSSLESNLIKNASGIDLLPLGYVYVAYPDVQGAPVLITPHSVKQSIDRIKSLLPLDSKKTMLAYSTFTVTNESNREMILLPQSDLAMIVCSDAKVFNASYSQSTLLPPRGQPFSLPCGATATIHVILYELFESLTFDQFKHNKCVSMGGSLVFSDIAGGTTNRAVKLISITGSICISEFEITNSTINLNKIGYIDGWQDHTFPIEIKNISECPLLLRIKSPTEILLPSDNVIDSLCTLNLLACFITNELSRSEIEIEREIELINSNNPFNRIIFKVFAKLTNKSLEFHNVSLKYDTQVVILPALEHPNTFASPQCDRSFLIVNKSDEMVETRFKIGNF
ncbi:hypothetical protein AKO1_015061, partial [Acrasis kona]